MSGRCTYADYQAVRTFGALDGLRCVAILAVVYHHCRTGSGGGLSSRGFLGVDLFFVISGFLIVTLLLREKERTRTISLGNFVARRALRIMPLYFGVIALSGLIFGVLRRDGTQSESFFRELPYYLSYTTNWIEVQTLLAITWSLSAEEQFYLFWPPLQKFAKRPIWWALGLVVVSLVIELGGFDSAFSRLFGWSANRPEMLKQTTFIPILLGVVLAQVLHERRGFDFVARVLGGRFTPLALFVVLLSSVALCPADLRHGPRFLLQVEALLLVASSVVREDHVLARPFRWAPIRRIGVLSYGIYLWHMFARDFGVRLVERARLPTPLTFLIVLASSVGIAELSYRFYEQPFLRLRGRFRDSPRAARASVEPADAAPGLELPTSSSGDWKPSTDVTSL